MKRQDDLELLTRIEHRIQSNEVCPLDYSLEFGRICASFLDHHRNWLRYQIRTRLKDRLGNVR